MKNLLIPMSLILTVNICANELKWVDEQVEAIKPPRSGVSKAKVNAVKNPFVFLEKNKEKSAKQAAASKAKTASKSSSLPNANKVAKKTNVLSLSAIINKSALINGKWYKLNDKVGRYTLSSVDGTTVILKYKNKELYLSTNSQSKNLKFKNN
jgi:hypothetical protein